MTRIFKLLIVAGCALLLAAAFLYAVPSDEYLLVPDRAQPLASKVLVKGERSDDDGGGIYYVAVEVDKASLFEKLFHGLPLPGIREGSTLVPASAVRAHSCDHGSQNLDRDAIAQLTQRDGGADLLRLRHRT